MATQSDFDNACHAFTTIMAKVTTWKHSYSGAAYSTRLRQAINDARGACDCMEAALKADDEPNGRLADRVPLSHRVPVIGSDPA